jgi:adenylate cyclase
MDRVWQRMWDRYGSRYSWATAGVTAMSLVPIFATSAYFIVAFEGADDYLASIGVAVVAAIVSLYGAVLPGWPAWRLVERCGAGEPVDRVEALASTYTYGRRVVARALTVVPAVGAVMGVIVGAICDADAGSLVQWGLVGGCTLLSVQLIPIHSYVESLFRPARRAIIGDSGIGDTMPRARPTFATWASIAVLSTVWIFTLVGALSGVIIHQASADPLVVLLIATGATLVFGVPITLLSAFVPSLQPLRDLREGTARVTAGNYDHPLPAVQDDDLGVLVAMFNRMQVGLREREHLHAAFGSYVDPVLAQRLLESGSSMFEGEHVVVTVLFADVRGFTAYAEGVDPGTAVERLNALFDVVVPVLQEHGGHANHYLGDGVLAVFGAPLSVPDHAGAAVAAAVEMQRRVRAEFGGELRLGIGINTGPVIAGTVGGGGRHEFTVIGDTVNVAARVEQLTKETGDAILITDATRAALPTPRPRSRSRGAFDVRGKAAKITVHAVNPFPRSLDR